MLRLVTKPQAEVPVQKDRGIMGNRIGAVGSAFGYRLAQCTALTTAR